jgi:hypothetical protein
MYVMPANAAVIISTGIATLGKALLSFRKSEI